MKIDIKEIKEELKEKYKKNKFYVTIFIKDFLIESWKDFKTIPIRIWNFIRDIVSLKNIFWVVLAIVMFTLFQGLILTLILGIIILLIILFKRAKSGEYVAREREREKQRALKKLEQEKAIEDLKQTSGPEPAEESVPENKGVENAKKE